jgi:osmotically-inducible protein OsmY
MPTRKKAVIRSRPDDEIVHDIRQALRLDSDVPDERITVRVQKGLATLEGKVESRLHKEAAETDARKVKGVRGITNLIDVQPPAWEAGV